MIKKSVPGEQRLAWKPADANTQARVGDGCQVCALTSTLHFLQLLGRVCGLVVWAAGQSVGWPWMGWGLGVGDAERETKVLTPLAGWEWVSLLS